MSNRSKKERRLTRQGRTSDTVQSTHLMAAIRSSPLPPPTEMEKYEGLMPGATETLFRNFINQSNHRMELEKETIRGDNRRADRGQIFSFILGILCILIGCVALFFFDKSGFAIAAIITAIAPIATAFLGASLSRKKERENKRKQMGA